MVKFEKPTDEGVKHVARNMRVADMVEVWEMSRNTPLESLEKGLKKSDFSSMAVIEGEPCAILGIIIVDILTGTGVPWLLATDKAVLHRREFLRNCKQGLGQMLDICPNLVNYVHIDNKVNIRWLKFMGFNVHKATPVGMNGAMFHKFSIGDC